MPLRVDRIRIKAFRGVREELTVRVGGRSLVLYGDNGTGKSTIVEALEFALSGNIKPLATAGQRVSVARHSHHVHCNPGDQVAEVVLSSPAGESRVGQHVDRRTLDPEVLEYLGAAADGTFILRRADLLAFITGADKNRYDALKPFLGLEAFAQMEASMKEARDSCVKRAEMAAARLEDSARAARIRLSVEPSFDLQPERLLALANARLADCGLAPLESLDGAATRKGEVERRVSALGSLDEVSALADARASLAGLHGKLIDPEHYQDLVARLARRRDLELKLGGMFYDQVLVQGQRWLQEAELDTCPLCEQHIDRAIVLARLAERLSQNAELTEARREANSAVERCRGTFEDIESAAGAALKAWCKAGFRTEDWPFHALEEAAVTAATLLKPGREGDVHALAQLIPAFQAAAYDQANTAAQAPISKRQASLANREAIQKLTAVLATVAWIADEYSAYAHAAERVAEEQALSAQADTLYSLAVAARKQASAEAFNEVATEVNRIYALIHPGEPLGNLQLEVKESGAGSAILRGDYAAKTGEDPRSYYSDAAPGYPRLGHLLGSQAACAPGQARPQSCCPR